GTSSWMYSSSHSVIETMCHRPRNGDLGFDFFFAMVSHSASMPEPVAVVPDQLAVPHGVVEFRQRDGKRLLTVPSFAEQAFLFVQLVLLGVEQSVDGQRHAVAFGPCLERELQVCRQVAVVGPEGFPADIGERVVVCQPEGHADPIVLVLL